MRPLVLLSLLLLLSTMAFSQKKKADQLYKSGIEKLDSKDYSGAIADFTEAIALKPTYAEAFYKRGIAKTWLSDNDGALLDFQEAIKYKHNYKEAYFESAYIRYDRYDNEGAIQDYTKVIELNPNDRDAYYNRALAKYSLKNYAGAISDNSKALEIDPGYINAYYSRALARHEMKDYAGAIADNTKIIGMDPKYINAYYSRALSKSALKDYEGSIKDCEKILEIDPNYSNAHYNIGFCNYNLQKYSESIPSYTKVIELKPDYSNAYYNRGLSRHYNKDYTGAIADFSKVIELSPSDDEAYYRRGLSKYYAKDFQGSIADYEKTIKINPDYEAAKKELAFTTAEYKRGAGSTDEAEDVNIEANIKMPQIWAVVVGVSQYKDASKNLKYADKDATDFYNFMKSPQGGALTDEHITLLTNEKATRGNIIKALNEKFNHAFEDDMVVLFIASHGQPDPVGNEVYFLNYDAESDNLGGTAVSQIDIEKVFQRTRAKKKIWFADACHSGGAGLQVRADHTALTNKLLSEIANSSNGMALLTASSSSEYSYEDAKWGGGHGVFTHYLLRGMKGEADKDANGLVDLRELYEFVYRQVSHDTNGQQHPELKGNFDNKLPIAVHK